MRKVIMATIISIMFIGCTTTRGIVNEGPLPKTVTVVKGDEIGEEPKYSLAVTKDEETLDNLKSDYFLIKDETRFYSLLNELWQTKDTRELMIAYDVIRVKVPAK